MILLIATAAWIWLVALGGVQEVNQGGFLNLLAMLTMFGTPLVVGYFTYQLARLIDVGPPIIWAVLSMLGCLGVVVLVYLCDRTVKWFARQGIKSGLLGPSQATLDGFEKGQSATRL